MRWTSPLLRGLEEAVVRHRIFDKMLPVEPAYFSTQVSAARRFYLQLNPGRSRPLAVVSGGCEQCRPDYEIRRSGFLFPTIEFVARGAGTLRMKGQAYELGPGTVYVYGPRVSHHIRTDPRQPMVKYFAVFSGRVGTQLLTDCQMAPGAVRRTTHPEQLQQVFDDLIQHGLSDHFDRHRLCTVALQYLIMKTGDLAMPYGQGATRAFATYQRCRQFIAEQGLHKQSLRDVAEACHVDLAYLCRLFQRFGRQSPYQYLLHLRMNRAVDLLHSGGKLVKEVAEELGFSDPGNFSRAFRKMFGVSPDYLRKTGGSSWLSHSAV